MDRKTDLPSGAGLAGEGLPLGCRRRLQRRVLIRRPPGAKASPRVALLAIGLTVALLTGACTQQNELAPASAGQQPPLIEQPDAGNLSVAPDARRVDFVMPTFSDPTNVTNPLFPISETGQVLMLGSVDGKPFRAEVTSLGETRVMEWNGRRIETVVSQYVAYLDGRIHEVALDLYAQDDNGAVWYFGEDVFNYKDGVVAETERHVVRG